MSLPVRYGIQGGRGSFNEAALQRYFAQQAIDPATIAVDYLYTTENVLAALAAGRIGFGQFAVENSIDGPVERSVVAMEQADFTQHGREIARYALPIAHCLMLHPAAAPAVLTTIISHPTVFRQCAQNLRARFPQLALQPGEGEFEDPAYVGQAIAAGDLPPYIATLTGRRVAELYGLSIIAEDMQDQNPNVTTFILATWREPR